MSDKATFQDFLESVSGETRTFVSGLHDELMEHGCKVEVKAAKSGYVVSYGLNKKTIANYVFRKKGLLARIYANHIVQYLSLIHISSLASAPSRYGWIPVFPDILYRSARTVLSQIWTLRIPAHPAGTSG